MFLKWHSILAFVCICNVSWKCNQGRSLLICEELISVAEDQQPSEMQRSHLPMLPHCYSSIKKEPEFTLRNLKWFDHWQIKAWLQHGETLTNILQHMERPLWKNWLQRFLTHKETELNALSLFVSGLSKSIFWNHHALCQYSQISASLALTRLLFLPIKNLYET